MALVQAVANDNGAGAATITATISSSTAGNCLVVVIGRNGRLITGVTDNQSQTYVQAYTPLNNGTEDTSTWVFPNTAAGVTLITATFSSSQGSVIFAIEESGLETSSVVDASAVTAGAVQATWSSSATAISSTTVGYGICCSTGGSSQSIAVTASGWSDVTGTGITAGHHGNATEGDDLYMCRQVFASSGSKTASGTLTSSVESSAIVLLKILASTAGNIAWITA
jgi:hypothetical protein